MSTRRTTPPCATLTAWMPSILPAWGRSVSGSRGPRPRMNRRRRRSTAAAAHVLLSVVRSRRRERRGSDRRSSVDSNIGGGCIVGLERMAIDGLSRIACNGIVLGKTRGVSNQTRTVIPPAVQKEVSVLDMGRLLSFSAPRRMFQRGVCLPGFGSGSKDFFSFFFRVIDSLSMMERGCLSCIDRPNRLRRTLIRPRLCPGSTSHAPHRSTRCFWVFCSGTTHRRGRASST